MIDLEWIRQRGSPSLRRYPTVLKAIDSCDGASGVPYTDSLPTLVYVPQVTLPTMSNCRRSPARPCAPSAVREVVT